MPSIFSERMSERSEYVIQYSGLKLGTHSFEFEIGKSFFESFDYTEILDCKVNVRLDLEKSTTMLVLLFEIKGEVTFPCDRCLEPVVLPISGNYRQVAKISDYEEPDDNDEIVVLPSAEYEIDVTKFIYDFIMLSVPYKRVHPEGGCDEEALKNLDDYLVEESAEDEDADHTEDEDNDDMDPRWKALLNIKNLN